MAIDSSVLKELKFKSIDDVTLTSLLQALSSEIVTVALYVKLGNKNYKNSIYAATNKKLSHLHYIKDN
jgi:hypothetical protein